MYNGEGVQFNNGHCMGRVQVQKEAATREYANLRYQQPYQRAMYEAATVLEARRWHTDDYESVIPDLSPSDLAVRARPPALLCMVPGFAKPYRVFLTPEHVHVISLLLGPKRPSVRRF
jgi:hypothetical protein